MISYLGSLVQFSPAAGRAGRCRQMSLCVGSSRRVLAKQPAVLGTTPRVLRAFSLRGERLGWPEVCARSPRVRCAFSLRGERLRPPEAWVPFPWVRRAFSLRGPSAPVGPQEVFRQEQGPVCQVGGGGFSGAEFAPFPSPCLLPPAGMGRLFSGVSQSLCFANRRQCVPAG